jgi:hypothetical protein
MPEIFTWSLSVWDPYVFEIRFQHVVGQRESRIQAVQHGRGQAFQSSKLPSDQVPMLYERVDKGLFDP